MPLDPANITALATLFVGLLVEPAPADVATLRKRLEDVLARADVGAPAPDRLLSWDQVSGIVPYCRQHVGRLEKQGLFPQRRWLSANRIAWSEADIRAWVANRALGAPPQGKQLRGRPAKRPAPDSEDLRQLRELCARLGVEVRRRREPERGEVGSGP
jgi:predicted DNA-binding transcriptional regulator AlpA